MQISRLLTWTRRKANSEGKGYLEFTLTWRFRNSKGLLPAEGQASRPWLCNSLHALQLSAGNQWIREVRCCRSWEVSRRT